MLRVVGQSLQVLCGVFLNPAGTIRWSHVAPMLAYDVGPALGQHGTNVLCQLGTLRPIRRDRI